MQNIRFTSKDDDLPVLERDDNDDFVDQDDAKNNTIHNDTQNENKPLCKFWVNTGNCLRNENCDFAHPKDRKGSRPQLVKNLVCKFWASTGFCAKMDACDFSHDGKPGSKPDVRKCKFFAEKGFCAKGDHCDFSHDLDDGNDTGTVCRFWLRGDCIKGPQCAFKHETGKRPRDSFDEQWNEPSPWAGRDRMSPMFDVRDQVRGGRGYFGQPNPPLDRYRPRGSMFIPRDNDHRKEDSNICKSYQRGRCSFGRSCAFVHVDSKEERNERDLEPSREPKRKLESGYESSEKRIKTQNNDQAFRTRVINLENIGAVDPVKDDLLNKMLKKIDLKISLQFAVHACIKCGERLVAKRDDPNRGKDIEDFEEDCSNILAAAIASKYPLHVIVGRLNAYSLPALTDSPTWFISPIDGMDNFLRGSPMVCVSIGLCVRRRPVLGVIHNPMMGHLFAAHKGGGTFFNNSEDSSCLVMKPLRLKNNIGARDSIVMNEYQGGLIRSKLSGIGVRFRETGSLNNNFLDVLRRVCDGGYQEGFDGPWSACAGVTLIEEAGGLATDFDGNLFEMDMKKPELVYGPKNLVEEILRSM